MRISPRSVDGQMAQWEIVGDSTTVILFVVRGRKEAWILKKSIGLFQHPQVITLRSRRRVQLMLLQQRHVLSSPPNIYISSATRIAPLVLCSLPRRAASLRGWWRDLCARARSDWMEEAMKVESTANLCVHWRAVRRTCLQPWVAKLLYPKCTFLFLRSGRQSGPLFRRRPPRSHGTGLYWSCR